MSNTYELQASRIEAVFAAYRVNARVWQATVTPRFVRFDITTALGTRLQQVERLAVELAMALGVKAVRVNRVDGTIHVEVPRADAARTVDLAALQGRLTGRIPDACALLGIDEGGVPLLLHIPSPDVAHVLIAGATGSGKTVLLRTLLASLAQRNRPGQLQFALLDPKGFSLAPFAALPHTRGLAQQTGEILAALTYLVAEMERRGRDARPRLIVAIDELAEIIMPAPEAIPLLTRLTQRGREVGIHVIAATQRPAAALIGGMVKANFPVRLVGSVVSPEDAKIATGRAGSGAENLFGRGDFLLICREEQIRFQVAYGDDTALAGLLAPLGQTPARPAPWLSLPAPVGLGGELGGLAEAQNDLFASAEPNPTQPNPTQPNSTQLALRTPLRERYTLAELHSFIAQAGGNLSEAAVAAFRYKDPVTLGIMRAAAQGDKP